MQQQQQQQQQHHQRECSTPKRTKRRTRSRYFSVEKKRSKPYSSEVRVLARSERIITRNWALWCFWNRVKGLVTKAGIITSPLRRWRLIMSMEMAICEAPFSGWWSIQSAVAQTESSQLKTRRSKEIESVSTTDRESEWRDVRMEGSVIRTNGKFSLTTTGQDSDVVRTSSYCCPFTRLLMRNLVILGFIWTSLIGCRAY